MWRLTQHISPVSRFISAQNLGTTVTVLNGPVLAEDKDIGPNAVVKYRLVGPRVDLFTVDANSGTVICPLQTDTGDRLQTAV